MVLYIMEDLSHATEVKIHTELCEHVRRHLRHPKAKTTQWHRVNDLQQAREYARDIARNHKLSWREAKCCM